jgi:site-specific recombinase XerD
LLILKFYAKIHTEDKFKMFKKPRFQNLLRRIQVLTRKILGRSKKRSPKKLTEAAPLEPKSRKKLSPKDPMPQVKSPEVLSLFEEPSRAQPSLPLLAQVPVSKAVEEFALVQLSPHSRKAYRGDLRDFFAYLRTRGIWARWNEELTPLVVAEYREYLFAERKLAKSSVTRKLAVVKSFCRWSLARGWLHQNPAEWVRGFPQTQDSKTSYLNLAEVTRLLSSFPPIPQARLSRALDRVIVETLLMLGLRRSEAASIHMKDIERLEESWVLRVHGKGDRERVLPIPERLLESWSLWLKRLYPEDTPAQGFNEDAKSWLQWLKHHASTPLLISTRSTKSDSPISSSEIGRSVRKSARRAGLAQRVSPHALRATAITHALDEGASHRGIQQMAGWTSPLMITRYDKRRKDHRFSAIHSLSYAKKDKNISWPTSEKPSSLA